MNYLNSLLSAFDGVLTRHPLTLFTLAHVLALGMAWAAATAVSDSEGHRMSPQAGYIRLVPIVR